jgi:hypothetical protein
VQAGQKRVAIPKSVKTQPIGDEPSTAVPYHLKTEEGDRALWRVGSVSASDFFKGTRLMDKDAVFFKSSNVRVFFPVAINEGTARTTSYYFVKLCPVGQPVNLLKILRCIEATSKAAAAHHLATHAGRKVVTEQDVAAALGGMTVSKLLLRRSGGVNSNQVYVVWGGA